MEKQIVRDILFLRQRAPEASGGIPTAEDIAAVEDLRDTLAANAERCVGLAGNMIGVKKRILVFSAHGEIWEMFFPVLLEKKQPYQTEEGCLSLDGTRAVTRYQKIKIQWVTREGKKKIQTFTGWTAQIIQHEMDHFEGTLI